eukprot:TRINITY_DN90809_c0_g1_i1.p1 TRINITY_DN90809_c0_g1~~TRINITY_DN90809_c0_g1_i1.p1  ORF type:complete len:363 (-),score=85.10 TRINITY_DN90809_c0_g1_i1:41-1129(-)
MGQCAGMSRTRSSWEILFQQQQAQNAAGQYVQEEELRNLEQIVIAWATEKRTGPDARQKFFEKVLRNQSHVALSLQSSANAATQSVARGASSGASIGHEVASTLSMAAAQVATDAARASGSRITENRNAQRVGMAAIQAIGVFGMLAGSVIGGVSTALHGGAVAGWQSRVVCIFVDRIFLRTTFEQAWELAAQHLAIEGVRPPPRDIEEGFLAKLQHLASVPQDRQTPQGIWLQIVQSCLCLELLRHIPAPPARVSVPSEPLMETLRLDHEYLEQRVDEILAQLNRVTQASSAMTGAEIGQRCPKERLTQDVEGECPVCLDGFRANTEVRRLPCNHLMHPECCEAWLKTAGTCPTCRHPVMS